MEQYSSQVFYLYNWCSKPWHFFNVADVTYKTEYLKGNIAGIFLYRSSIASSVLPHPLAKASVRVQWKLKKSEIQIKKKNEMNK